MFTPPENSQTDFSANQNENMQISETDVHTMPDKFLGMQPQISKKISWVILGIALFIGLGGVIAAVLLFLNRSVAPEQINVNQPPINSPANNSVINEEAIQATTTTPLIPTAGLRDAKRLEDVAALRTALSLYFKTYQNFPDSLERLAGEFIKEVPTDPGNISQVYFYRPTSGKTNYSLSFSLEEGGYWGVSKLTNGAYYATAESILPGTAPDSNTNANTNTALPEMPSAEAVLSRGLDSDGDQLTDIEENMYKTDPNLADTDNDNSTDSTEILNHYDPLKGNRARLIDSGLVSVFRNPSFPYSTFYPTAWSARALTDDNAEVIFTSSTGEFIEIIVQKNPLTMSLYNWYAAQNKGADLSKLKSITVASTSALQSPDGLNTYVALGSNIYVLTYNVGAQQQMNFYTTYELFLKSFIFLPTPAVLPAGNTASTTATTTPAQ